MASFSPSFHPVYYVTTILNHVPFLDGNVTTYSTWVMLFQEHATAYGVSHHIDGTKPPAKTDPSYKSWAEIDMEVLHWIHDALPSDLLIRIFHPTSTASEALIRLQNVFLFPVQPTSKKKRTKRPEGGLVMATKKRKLPPFTPTNSLPSPPLHGLPSTLVFNIGSSSPSLCFKHSPPSIISIDPYPPTLAATIIHPLLLLQTLAKLYHRCSPSPSSLPHLTYTSFLHQLRHQRGRSPRLALPRSSGPPQVSSSTSSRPRLRLPASALPPGFSSAASSTAALRQLRRQPSATTLLALIDHSPNAANNKQWRPLHLPLSLAEAIDFAGHPAMVRRIHQPTSRAVLPHRPHQHGLLPPRLQPLCPPLHHLQCRVLCQDPIAIVLHHLHHRPLLPPVALATSNLSIAANRRSPPQVVAAPVVTTASTLSSPTTSEANSDAASDARVSHIASRIFNGYHLCASGCTLI